MIIARHIVIFWEFNRGNVFNLLDQIAPRKFKKVARDANTKSMWIGNSIDFYRAALQKS